MFSSNLLRFSAASGDSSCNPLLIVKKLSGELFCVILLASSRRMKLVKSVLMIGLILRNSIELTTVLPNTGVIRQALKNYKDDLLSFEAVFAYHHFVDPLSVCTEVLGKFGTDCRFVHEIKFSC